MGIKGAVKLKNYIWNIGQSDPDAAKKLSERFGLSSLAAEVLASRGFDENTATDLLQGKSQDLLHDPMMMRDMDKAAAALSEAIEAGEYICVYGDYDCDGVAATAIIKSYLESVGARNCFYIPEREKEGYGLNNAAIDELHRLGVTFILTVDNGVSAVDEIDYANSLGMRVVVTDHHRPPEKMPNAVAVVDPHRSDCDYPFKELCGAGVAFKLLCAMEGENGEDLIEQFADFLAIGTVGDVVSLSDENRYFVKCGLELMRDSYRPGIRALLQSASLEGKPLTGESIAFGIAPRINAAGRLSTADLAVMLLLTESDGEAEELAAELDGLNIKRRSEEKRIIDEVAMQIKAQPQLLYNRILVFSGEGWNAGVVGIVCSRLTERFGKPSLLISIDGEAAKGSGRSVEGFSLIEAVSSCKHLLSRYGGHPMAAGFSLEAKSIDAFVSGINGYAAGNFKLMPAMRLNIDFEIRPEMMTVEQVKGLAKLEPFGSGNSQPVLMVREARVTNVISLSEGKHSRVQLEKNGAQIALLCFFTSPAQLGFDIGYKVDAAFGVSINEYRGSESITMRAEDIRLSELDTEKLFEQTQLFEGCLRGEVQDGTLIPSREETAAVYRYLRGSGSNPLILPAIFFNVCKSFKMEYIKFLITMETLFQTGLIEKRSVAGAETVIAVQNAQKVQLENSPIVRSLRSKL